MPNLAGIHAGQIDAELRAVNAWRRIQRDPASVVILRGVTPQTAQTMRVVLSNGGSNTDSPLGQVGTKQVVIYGVMGHPSADVPDSDIKRLDRVIIGGDTYTFDEVIFPPGEVQAFGTVKSK